MILTESTVIGIFDLYARNLPAEDANGYSDPFVKFKGKFIVRHIWIFSVSCY